MSLTRLWRMKTLIALSSILWISNLTGCSLVDEKPLGPQADVVRLEKAQEAPFEGWLLSDRMFSILYRDAKGKAIKEIKEELKEEYGTD